MKLISFFLSLLQGERGPSGPTGFGQPGSAGPRGDPGPQVRYGPYM